MQCHIVNSEPFSTYCQLQDVIVIVLFSDFASRSVRLVICWSCCLALSCGAIKGLIPGDSGTYRLALFLETS